MKKTITIALLFFNVFILKGQAIKNLNEEIVSCLTSLEFVKELVVNMESDTLSVIIYDFDTTTFFLKVSNKILKVRSSLVPFNLDVNKSSVYYDPETGKCKRKDVFDVVYIRTENNNFFISIVYICSGTIIKSKYKLENDRISLLSRSISYY